jgi:glucose dehydrogenase
VKSAGSNGIASSNRCANLISIQSVDMLASRPAKPILLSVLAFTLLLASSAAAQEWPSYGNDPGGSRYSPLDQIDRSNVTRLRPAWEFRSGDWSDGTANVTRSAFAATPLVIDGVLYVTTPFNRLFALDAETGKQLWVFELLCGRPHNTSSVA